MHIVEWNLKQEDVNKTKYDKNKESHPWHMMYKNKKWKLLRGKKLTLNPLCELCGDIGVEIDHIINHKGDGDKFYSYDNLQTLCSSCHAIKTINETRIKNLPVGTWVLSFVFDSVGCLKNLLSFNYYSEEVVLCVCRDKIKEFNRYRQTELTFNVKNSSELIRIYLKLTYLMKSKPSKMLTNIPEKNMLFSELAG